MIKSDELLVRIKRQNKSEKPMRSSGGSDVIYATVGQNQNSVRVDSLHFRKNGDIYATVNKSRHNSADDHTYMVMNGLPRNSIIENEYMSMNGISCSVIYDIVRKSSRVSNSGHIYASLKFSCRNSIRRPQRSVSKEPIYTTFNEPVYASIKTSIEIKTERNGIRTEFLRHPYDIIKHRVEGSMIYECNDYMFTSYFLARIYSHKLKHSKIGYSKIPHGFLFKKKSDYDIVPLIKDGRLIFECGPYGFLNLKEAQEYKEKVYRNVKKRPIKIPAGTLLKSNYLKEVIWYDVKGTKIYECGNYAFKTFKEAKIYSRFLLANPKKKYSYPKYCMGESRHKIHDFDITVYLGLNRFSYKIWYNVWQNCDFLCFSRNHFQVLKAKLLLEINTYRARHGSPKLIYKNNLDKAAQMHANQIIVTEKISRFSDDKNFGTTVGISYYLAGSTVAKKWYDESSKYGFFFGRARPGTQMFTQIIWRSSKNVGFGVAMSEDTIVVVAKFFPKGNIRRKYIANVIPRR
uniref:CAP domain-containing protein (inferred by orthology to a zebrafish protein) n=1 Tax=Strongyloides venezuelensis TaxID=75913 RepID=A0A0K0G1L8_STRVS